MRWHVHTEALHPDGDLAAGHLLSFYTDSGMGTLATLYALNEPSMATVDNPYPVPLDGEVDFWTEDPSLWVLAEGDTAPRPLNIDTTIGSGEINVKDYGAVGDGVTNDTDAFVLAIAAQRTISQASFIAHGDIITDCPPIRIPAGRYSLDTGHFNIDYSGARFIGDGEHATFLVVPSGLAPGNRHTDGHLFHIGAADLDLTPTVYWLGSGGVGMYFECRDMTIYSVDGYDWHGGTLTDPRVGTCFYDNGIGNMKFYDVTVMGFEYGFCSPYGHDFGYHYNCNYYMCDVGMYFGPGAEQVYLYGMNIGICHENIVMDGCTNMVWSGLDTSTPIGAAGYDGADIVFEGGELGVATRLGVTRIWHQGCKGITIDNLWEERVWDDGEVGGAFRAATAVDQYVLYKGTIAHRNIVFNNPYISDQKYSGESMVGKAWLRVDNDQYDNGIPQFEVNNPFFANGETDRLFEAVVSCDGAVCGEFNFRMRNPTANGGAWPPETFSSVWHLFVPGETVPVGYDVVMDKGWGRFPGTTHASHSWSNRLNFANDVSTAGYSIWANLGASLNFGSTYDSGTTWGFNLGMNPVGDGHSGYLFFGPHDDAARNKVFYGDAVPAANAHIKGDICYNTDPTGSGGAKPFVGWVCTASGTPGTWKKFGAVTEV